MNFDKESKSDFLFGGRGGGEVGVGVEIVGDSCLLKPTQYARLSNKVKYKNLHNVEHVVPSTFQNLLITF